jgi:Mycobacterium membrane protein
MLAMLKRGWVALVVVMVVSLGSIGVLRLRGVFGSDPIFSATAGQAEQLPQVNVKHVMYEVLGPADTAGSVSYVDKDSRPGQANFSSLPWRYTIATTMSSVIANVVAQGDSSNLRCRITVNGEVKDEHYSSEHHAQASCLVKAA